MTAGYATAYAKCIGYGRKKVASDDRVLCAAVRDRNGRVWVGFAHGTIIANIFPRKDKLGHEGFGAEHGFVLNTHDGRFVGRIEALAIATKAGQIIKKYPPRDRLLSEDLRDALDTNDHITNV